MIDDALLPYRERRLDFEAPERFAFDAPPGLTALVRVFPAFTADVAALRALHARHLTGEGAHGRVPTAGLDDPRLAAVEAAVLGTLSREYRIEVAIDYATLVRLETGQFHARHADNAFYDCAHGGTAAHRRGEDCAAGRWRPQPGNERRDLSAFLYLDDAAGGDLYFPLQGLVVPRAAGTLVTYPANRFFLHEVLPVAAGPALSLQLWATRG
jgi:hypothetical protein